MARLSLEDRVKRDPKLLAHVLANPGLRSKLPAKYLTPKQRQQRALNTRLRQPIVPGSTVTERDLSHEAQAAMTVKYGPRETQEKQTLGEEQARSRDTSGWYDQYLAQVAQHSRNVQAIGGIAAQTGQRLQQGITGLSAADLTGLQNPAVADAATRGATAGDLTPLASNAAAIRQALAGSFTAQQAGQTAAASNYADAQAHVVAPGQKLGAQAMSQGRVRQAGENIAATTRERAADDLLYRYTRKTDEGKNILAGQIAGVEAADKLADNALAGAKVTETTRHNQAGEKEAAKKRRALVRKAATDAANAAGKRATSGPFAGLTQDQIKGLSDADAKRLVDKYNAPKAKPKGKDGKGPEWLTPGQAGAGLAQLTELKKAAARAKAGEPFIDGHGRQKPKTPEEARVKILGYAPFAAKLKHPALVTAAVDAIYLHFLQNTTVQALKAAGYKPSEVARTLGVPTSGQIKADDPKPGRPG